MLLFCITLFFQMSPLERRAREREGLRARLLTAALELAIAESWQAVTMRKIAAAVAYTTSVVYEHFASKEVLLQALAEQGFEQLYAQLKKAVAEDQNPKSQLRNLALINWDFASNNREWYQLMFSLDRASLKGAHHGFGLIQDVFQRLTGKPEHELGPIMRLPDEEPIGGGGASPRRLYLDFMERFISSIT